MPEALSSRPRKAASGRELAVALIVRPASLRRSRRVPSKRPSRRRPKLSSCPLFSLQPIGLVDANLGNSVFFAVSVIRNKSWKELVA